MIIFGRWQSFKSMLTNHAGYCIAMAQDWLGMPTQKANTLIVQTEVPEVQFQDRWQKYIQHAGIVPSNLYMMTEPFIRLDNPKHMTALQQEIVRTQAQVIILDPFYRLFSGNITDNFQIQYLLDKFDELIARYNISLIMVGHTRKTQHGITIQDWGQELIGGSYIMDWVDTAISAHVTSHDRVRISFDKTRHAKTELKPIMVQFNRSTLQFTVL